MKKLLLILLAAGAAYSYSHRAHAAALTFTDDSADLVKTMQAQDAKRQAAVIERVLRDADNAAAINAMCHKRYPTDGYAEYLCFDGLKNGLNK